MGRYICSIKSDHDYRKLLGDSSQADNSARLLKSLGAKTAIIEKDYIDRSYLIDYSKFFSRSFENVKRFTKRVHFFSFSFATKRFETAITDYNDDGSNPLESDKFFKKLIEGYLGFVIIKPLKDRDGHSILGRTVIKCRGFDPEIENFIFKNNYVNLFGIPLVVKSLPFQAQDKAVAACATTSLWIANEKMRDMYGTKEYSPAEITEIATHLIEMERIFPSNSLVIKQMLNFLKELGMDYEIIDITHRKQRAFLSNEEMPEEIRKGCSEYLKKAVPNIVKAYVGAGMPIIATLTLENKAGNEFLHTAVISGYKLDDNRNVTELYIHDDQIGPYSIATSVAPIGSLDSEKSKALDDYSASFLEWKNYWIDGLEYKSVIVDKLLIPIYPKIRMDYDNMYLFCKKYFEEKLEKLSKQFPVRFDLEVYLTSVQEYKKQILKSEKFSDKLNILKMPFSRLVWVAELYLDDHIINEVVFDATSHYPRPITEIDYRISV